MNDNKQQPNNLLQPQNQTINLSDFQQASSQQIIVEFARTSYPMMGAVIDGNLIKGNFGYGEIQQPRNERLVMLQGDNVKLIQSVSKIIITKSILKKKENQQPIKKNNQSNAQQHPQHNLQHQEQPNNQQQQINLLPQAIQQEQRFFSESSKSSDQQERQQRQAKNMIKKRSLIKKQEDQKSSKISKNILKKKLKFLSTRK